MPSTKSPAAQPVECLTQLNTGDLLLRRKGSVMHMGVYLGNQQVLDNAPKRGVSVVSYETFAKDKKVYASPSHLPPEDVLKNAEKALQSPGDYNLLKHNCEHTARKILHLEPKSAQLAEVESWALIGAALGRSFGRGGLWLGALIGTGIGVLSLPKLGWFRQIANHRRPEK